MDVTALGNYFNEQFIAASVSTWDTIRVAIIHGGWMGLFVFFIEVSFGLFYDRMTGLFAGGLKFTYLAVSIPKLNEQTPRAVENFFNQLAGAHVTQDLVEKYWLGELQPWFSFEIVSIEGYLQFIIYTPKKFRDLTEAALYAQYPDAEITEIEDYCKFAPAKFPDAEYDAWGTEFTLAHEAHFPLLTYKDFEHSVTKEYFKDPMAAMLEAMSRIGKGEQVWFQIFVQPTGKDWQKKHFAEAAALTTKLVDERATAERPFPLLHRGETDLVEAVHHKATKNGFKCKMRAIYIAKKEVYNAKRVQYGVVGALKQYSRDDSNGIKPLYSLTGVTGHYLFKDWQKNNRKTDIVTAFRKRSGSRGGDKYILNTEELATLWHFPLAHAVRAPSLAVVQAKRGEAPGRLPLESEFDMEPDGPPIEKPEPVELTPERIAPEATQGASHRAPPPPNLPTA